MFLCDGFGGDVMNALLAIQAKLFSLGLSRFV
jgi:hypothetical protein